MNLLLAPISCTCILHLCPVSAVNLCSAPVFSPLHEARGRKKIGFPKKPWRTCSASQSGVPVPTPPRFPCFLLAATGQVSPDDLTHCRDVAGDWQRLESGKDQNFPEGEIQRSIQIPSLMADLYPPGRVFSETLLWAILVCTLVRHIV